MIMLKNIYFPARYFIALAFLVSSLNAYSAANNWVNDIGARPPLWSIQENWSLGVLPTSIDDVTMQLNNGLADVISVDAVANSLLVSNGMRFDSEASISVVDWVQLSTSLGSPTTSLTLFNGGSLSTGLSPSSTPSLLLTGGSRLNLSGLPGEVNAGGLIEVDSVSEIRGAGEINANDGFNLNGTLSVRDNSVNDTLLINSAVEVDLDGSNDTGKIKIGSESHLVISAPPSDAFSGSINIDGPDSSLSWVTVEDLHFDGNLMSFESETNIQANNFLLSGKFTFMRSNLNINTTAPWRLDGEIEASGGTSNLITGSSFIVGSNTGGEAFLNATEHIIVVSDVILEPTAKIKATNANGAQGEITFVGNVDLFGPDVNNIIGPWPGVDGGFGLLVSPRPIRFYGNTTIHESSTIYAGEATFGDGTLMNINMGNDFTVDAKNLLNQSTVEMNINSSVFTLNLRDPLDHPVWTNNMTMILSNGTFDLFSDTDEGIISNLIPGSFCHQGTLSGTGTVNASFLAVDPDGVICAGTISPGLSPGVISINGSVESSAMEFVMEIAGDNSSDHDQLIVNGDLSISGGTLAVEFIDGFIPSNDSDFTLFVATGNQVLDFSSIELRGLSDAFRINTDQLNADGSIEIEKMSICERRRFKNSKLCKRIKKIRHRYKTFFEKYQWRRDKFPWNR